jgi:hypothetical protein
VVALALLTRHADAEPQWNGGLVAGLAGTSRSALWSDTAFFGALRGDVLLGRSSNRDIGAGPSLELGTVGFADVRILGGITALFPLGELLAVAMTPGAYARAAPGGTVPGASGRAFFGIRPYNYGSRYGLAGGLILGFDQDLGQGREHACTIAVQVDGLLLALPAMLLVGWLRGPPD